MILVSACLLGHSVRYDGRHSLAADLAAELKGRRVLALCPEVLGGLGIPRPPARFVGACSGQEGLDVVQGRARLLDDRGRDVTRAFLLGARAVVRAAMLSGVRVAYLKDRSPSCGFDPEGSNPEGGPGLGVLAALLLDRGVEIREVRARAQGTARLKQNGLLSMPWRMDWPAAVRDQEC